MASFSVVAQEPWRERLGAFVVALEDVLVCPLAGEGAVEAFDFTVLPGAVRADELVLDLVSFKEFAEPVAVPVAPGVVGHHPLDRDAVACEEVDGLREEVGCLVSAFVAEDL